MLAEPAPGDLEPERERLRQDIRRPGEIQRQQQRLLLQRLEPVQPPRRHHELQSRPVTLPPAPGEPADRLALSRRHRPQIPDHARHVTARRLPRGSPPPRPLLVKRQAPAFRVADPAPEEQLIMPAPIRQHRHHVTHGHLTSTTRGKDRLAFFCQMDRDIPKITIEPPSANYQSHPPTSGQGHSVEIAQTRESRSSA
jgi:hypothetical protein